ALKTDGSLWAWGANQSGQIGDGSISTSLVPANKKAPVRIGSDNDWTAVAAGGSSSISLKANGTLWAWGSAPGTALVATSPVQIGTDTNWKAVAAGESHVLALKADGTLWSWGNNTKGQLGDGSVGPRTLPAQ